MEYTQETIANAMSAVRAVFNETPESQWLDLAEHINTSLQGWKAMQGLPKGSVIPPSLPFSAYLSQGDTHTE